MESMIAFAWTKDYLFHLCTNGFERRIGYEMELKSENKCTKLWFDMICPLKPKIALSSTSITNLAKSIVERDLIETNMQENSKKTDKSPSSIKRLHLDLGVVHKNYERMRMHVNEIKT